MCVFLFSFGFGLEMSTSVNMKEKPIIQKVASQNMQIEKGLHKKKVMLLYLNFLIKNLG